jgi:hypothetical protein
LPSPFQQTDNVCSNFFGVFGECMCIHCSDCSLVSTYTNKTQVALPVTHMVRWRNSLLSWWYHSKRVKAEAIVWISFAPMCIFRTHLVQNLW